MVRPRKTLVTFGARIFLIPWTMRRVVFSKVGKRIVLLKGLDAACFACPPWANNDDRRFGLLLEDAAGFGDAIAANISAHGFGVVVGVNAANQDQGFGAGVVVGNRAPKIAGADAASMADQTFGADVVCDACDAKPENHAPNGFGAGGVICVAAVGCTPPQPFVVGAEADDASERRWSG